MVSNLWERSVPGEASATKPTRHQVLIERVRSGNQEEADDLTEVYALFTYHQRRARRGQRASRGGSIDAHDPEYADALLRSLHFADLDSRIQAIPRAYNKTYGWVLKEPRPSEDADALPLWSSFPDWLREDSESIYWITGKPGSGKSTLMKHLIAQPETLSHLERWSGHREVFMATYYSWDAGSDLQKSQVGLLRTILYQTVERIPEIAPQLFPGRWAMQKIFGPASLDHLPPWTWEELVESVGALITLPGRDFNLAIFVDGLDEFAGDHSRLIDLVRQFHSQPGVKVCVSSRPWNNFRDAFVSCPQLKMEILTENDLNTFVHGVSRENVAFMELHEAHPTEAQDLLAKIVERACGVFLWVSLVMKTMLGSLTNGATLTQVEHLVDSLPEDLSNLYTRLWQRVKDDYKREGSRLLLLFRTYANSPILDLKAMKVAMPSGMEAEMLWLADRRPPEDPRHMLRVLRRKLNSCTMGLLELAPRTSQVNYLHRTTKEWLDIFWPEMRSDTPAHFDTHLELLSAVSRMASNDPNSARNKFKTQPTSWKSYCNMWGWMLEAFYHAGKVVHDPHGRLVKALDRVEGVFRNIRFMTTTMIIHPSHWAKVERGSAEQFGFVGLAAEFGVFRYVRAKIDESPDYVSIEGCEEDLISCLLLGPGRRGLPKREYRALSNTPLRERLDCIREYVFDHMSFNHAGRYQVAELILTMCGGKKRKIPAALRIRLARLAERVAARDKEGWPHKDLASALVETAGGEMPYSQAVTELLEKYGIEERKNGVRESVRAWLQWKLETLSGV
ncbi:Vegetative incompatibility protein HET-E-1 [Madurella mycetomatis]|uniref:Vegetative incompatibility protein HET-E-1 n=1 Tax=Madurella mycetomatis TaxID=100816 RepID=A0A175VY32_9PEZI|nr:Vegetative incompatibility protein HET-E-1 [Madurella mycetomatis]